jgi:hypothetical protein
MTPNVSGTATKASFTKVSQVGKAQANLPLPEIPPVPSDWNSADARTVNSRAGEGASTETRQSERQSNVGSNAKHDTH